MSERYKRWYNKNKEKLAEQRKERYRTDTEYRETKKAIAKRHYWFTKRRAKPLKEYQVDIDSITPNEVADIIISNENDVRCGMTIPIPMYYPSILADLLKRSVQTLRLWALTGVIPEATYRSFGNYRLYTKDQVKVYLQDAQLLKLRVKDFDKHPYFVQLKDNLAKLEPDGITVMDTVTWRLIAEKCEWCSNDVALQHYTTHWQKVPCFSCITPYTIEERKATQPILVEGMCNFCNKIVTKQVHSVGTTVMLVCDTCNRRIPDAYVKEVV